MQAHRHCATACIDERAIKVDIADAVGYPEPEFGGKPQHRCVMAVDELSAALAHLSVGESMAPHASTDAMASFDDHDVQPLRRQIDGTAESGESGPDDDDVDEVRRLGTIGGCRRSGRQVIAAVLAVSCHDSEGRSWLRRIRRVKPAAAAPVGRHPATGRSCP